MNRWGFVAFAYVFLGAVSAWLAIGVRGDSVLLTKSPWLVFDTDPGAHLFSSLLGLSIAALVVLSTRWMVFRLRFAQALHADLRPLALSLTPSMVIVLALTSAFGEELFFRGLLMPWIGIIPQALLFGVLHQTSGKSRWVWMAWAFAIGLTFGATCKLTGSLSGPLIAHALINAVNFWFLKSHDPDPERRPLGGLLGQRS